MRKMLFSRLARKCLVDVFMPGWVAEDLFFTPARFLSLFSFVVRAIFFLCTRAVKYCYYGCVKGDAIVVEYSLAV